MSTSRSSVRIPGPSVKLPDTELSGPRGKFGLLSLVLAIVFGGSTALEAQVITEIMYHSVEQQGDGSEDKRFEYIEIYNDKRDPLDLSGYTFSDGISFTFPPGTFLDGYRYLVVCADPDHIESVYGINNAIGPWSASTSLNNAGERVILSKPGGAEAVRVNYNDRGKWPSGADGTGHSLEIRDPYIEVDDPDSWRLSRDLGGSPGQANPSPGDFTVIINEGLIATTGTPFVELYNFGDSEVNLGGYHLTTDRRDFEQTTIPGGTTIAPRSWVHFTEADLGWDLSLPADDDRVFVALVHPDGDRILDAYIFRPQLMEGSEARFPDGDEDVEDAATPTPGAANEIPLSGAIVINEIMYHPTSENDDDEYVEIYNRSDSTVDLTGWEFNKGINYIFEDGQTLGAGEYLVIARNPAHIRSVHGLPASRVVGPQTPEALDDFGRLSNRGERITLKNHEGNTEDTVRYRDGGEWAHWADGRGSSLELIDPFQDNNNPQSWDASDDSDKAEVQTFLYSGQYLGGEPELQFYLKGRGIWLVDDVALSTDGGAFVEDEVFVEVGDTWRWFKGTQEPSSPTSAWRQQGYDDSGWLSGATSIGYGDGPYATTITDMRNSYMSIFCRKTFNVSSIDDIDQLILSVAIDDGFYAYLNGVQIHSHNVTGRGFDDEAESAGETVDVVVDVSDFKDELVVGSNVLAIQVHNAGLNSSDITFTPRLYSATFEAGGGVNLLTNGDFDSNDNGWKFEGNHIRSGRTTENPIAGSGSMKVVSTGRGDYKVNRIETPDGSVGLGSLQNGQTYTISFRARWVVGSRSIQTRGYNNAYPKNHQFDLPEDLGSPGRPNTARDRHIAIHGDDNLGPVLRNLRQSHAQPGSSTPVQVSVRVDDSDGVDSVVLTYGLGNPPDFEPGGSGDPDPVGIFDDHRDVGGPCGDGDLSFAGGDYTLTAGGNDIWTGGDQFHYGYKVVTGDFSMRARIVSRDWAGRWGKGGIMARQTLDNTSRYFFIHDNPVEDAARVALRPTHLGSDNEETPLTSGDLHPDWMRLDRVGNEFRAYFSTNGTSWGSPVETVNWGGGAPRTIYLGLALTSHADCDTATVVFDDVVLTGGDDPPDPIGGGGDGDTIPMSDPDGDGIYTATLPGFSSNTKVVYAISATDDEGNVGRYPADRLARVNPMILSLDDATVIDQAYAVMGVGSAPSSPRGAHTYQFWMSDAHEAYMSSRLLQSNDLVEGSFVFRNSQIFHNAGIRFSGSPWARQGWGGSFRVKFPRDKPLHEQIRKFNTEDHQGAGGLDARERTSHYLIRYNQGMISVPYSEQWFVRWRVNTRGTEDREHVAPPNSQFLDNWFPDESEGDFFEMDDRFEFNDGGGRVSNRDASLRYPPHNSGSGSDKENYRFYLGLRQHEDEDDYSTMIDLARIMDPSQTGNTAFDNQIHDHMDVEQVLRVLLIRMNTDDWDTWGTNRGKNCYFYRPEVSGLYQLFAWDCELTYGNVDSFLIPSNHTSNWGIAGKFPEVGRMVNRPNIRRMAYGIMKEMVDNHFWSNHLNTYMVKVQAVGGANTGIGRSGGFIDSRRSRLIPRLNGVTHPTVQLNISGSDSRTISTPTISLSGSAPVEASFLQVVINGSPVPDVEAVFSTSSMTSWSLPNIPVPPGDNNLEVLGFNGLGDLIDSDSISVSSSFDRDPPSISSLSPSSAEPGEEFTIHGENFFTGLDVFFDGVAISSSFIDLKSSTEIDVTVPGSVGLGNFSITVVNRPDDETSNAMDFEVTAPEPRFIRGDANLDGYVDVGDAVRVLVHVFLGEPTTCEEALDADDDGGLDQTDAVRILDLLFLGGADLPVPFPGCGVDDDADALDCQEGFLGCFDN